MFCGRLASIGLDGKASEGKNTEEHSLKFKKLIQSLYLLIKLDKRQVFFVTSKTGKRLSFYMAKTAGRNQVEIFALH
jgi:hypothetical protein